MSTARKVTHSRMWPLRRSRSSESISSCKKRNTSTAPYERLNEVNTTKSKSSFYGGSSREGETIKKPFCECSTDPENNETCSACRLSFQKSKAPTNGTALSPGRERQMSITVLDSDEHCHDNDGKRDVDRKARKKLWIASMLCVVFMIAEAVGGILAGSLAIATDAAHLLTDFAGFMISLFALYIAERPATKRLSYGYHRAEVIGALTSVLLIWVVTGILVYMAVERILNQNFEIDAPIMLITSGVGLIVNIIMGFTLHQHGHSHGGGSAGHGHSHGGASSHGNHAHGGHDNNGESGADVETGPDLESSHGSSSSGDSTSNVEVHKPNINVRAAFIHVIGDFLQSVGVFAAAIVIYCKPEWAIVDPICTFLFSILVLGTTYAIVTDTLVVLMEGIPKGINFNEVRETLLKVHGVCKVHNLRIWSLSMDRIALSAHLAVDPKTTKHSSQILRKSSQLVKSKYGFSEVTIQIEDFSEKMQDCVKCQELN